MSSVNLNVIEWNGLCDKHGPFRAKGMVINGKRMGGACGECLAEREKADSAENESRARAAKARRIKQVRAREPAWQPAVPDQAAASRA